MTSELSPVEARLFRDFEHDGWQTVATAYQDVFAPLVAQSIDALLDGAGVRRGVKVLDVATGPGHVAAAAASREAVVTGIDFSSKMVSLARARHPNVEFVDGDAENLPFDDGSFEAVVMGFGLLHLGRPDLALREAYRVLRSGGRLGLSVWAPPSRAVGFGILLDAIEAHGEKEAPLLSGPSFFRFSDPVECARSLENAGFVRPTFVTVPQVWRLATPEELFEALCHATVRTAALIRAQGPSALGAVRAAVDAGARRHLGPHGVDLPMPAIVASGLKASAGLSSRDHPRA
jgi:SAM-dependent methyltransferase